MTSLQRGLKSQRGPEDEPAASSIAAQSFAIARCNFQTWITQQTTDTSLWHAVCFIGYQRPPLNCSLHSLLLIDKTELSDILIFWLYGPRIDRWRHTIHAFRCLLIMVWPSLVAALRGKIFLQSDVRQLKSYSSSWSPTWKESSPHKLLNPSKIPRICFNLAIITCNQMTELQTVCERAQQTTFSTSERDRNMSQIQTKYLVFESFESQSAPNFPVGSKNIMSAEKKKNSGCVIREHKTLSFQPWMGGKKNRPKHEFSRVVSPQRPTTDRNFELFWWLVGEKCYLVIRGRRTCHRKSYTALTFAVQRGSQRAIVWRPADFAYKQALAENFITDELMTATKKLPIKCLRTAVFRDNELLSLLELKLSFEVILLYFDTWGGFCVCGMIIFSSGWLEKIWNE